MFFSSCLFVTSRPSVTFFCCERSGSGFWIFLEEFFRGTATLSSQFSLNILQNHTPMPKEQQGDWGGWHWGTNSWARFRMEVGWKKRSSGTIAYTFVSPGGKVFRIKGDAKQFISLLKENSGDEGKKAWINKICPDVVLVLSSGLCPDLPAA